MAAFDWQSFALGGTGRSTNPNDYQASYTDRDQIQNLINQGLGRTNQAAPTLDQSQSNQFRGMQLDQAQQLARIASGQQQGAGELAAQRQAQNAIAQQQGMARMARGMNSALAFRNSASNAANIGLAGAGQAQQAALQDQQAAQSQLGQTLNSGRTSDINIAGQNASNSLQQQQLNNQMYINMLQQLTGMNAAELQARLGAMQSATGQQGMLGSLFNNAGQVGSSAAMSGGGAGAGAGGAGGAAAMASDKRLKKDIADAGDDIDAMLDHLYPKSYRYKDPGRFGGGRRAGIMAQDLQRSKAGRDIVSETDDGLMLDKDKALSASLAGLARLHQRIRELEKQRPTGGARTHAADDGRERAHARVNPLFGKHAQSR